MLAAALKQVIGHMLSLRIRPVSVLCRAGADRGCAEGAIARGSKILPCVIGIGLETANKPVHGVLPRDVA